MRRTLIALLMLPFLACAISGGPLDPEGDPTPSGAEMSPPPDPIAGTIAQEPEVDTSDLSRVRQTMSVMERLGRSLAAYRDTHGRYPDTLSISEVAEALGGTDDFVDGWGRPLRYEVRDGGRSYVLASAGSDGEVNTADWETTATLSNTSHDIVFRDGRWIRSWPE